MSQAEDSLAKKRFFAITAMRLMGAFFVLIGFVLIRGGWELAGQPTDRWIGVAVVLVGGVAARGYYSRQGRPGERPQGRPGERATPTSP